ncbi:MAG: hypothetical protein ACREV7_11405 [Steroidobacteraceae bacterium]
MALSVIPRALRWLPLRQLLWALLGGLALILFAAAVNVIGIRVVGDVNGWAHWLRVHRGDFVAWRLFLYGVTGWGWWWMRERVQRREPGAHARLLRVEIATVLVILALEGVAFLQP